MKKSSFRAQNANKTLWYCRLAKIANFVYGMLGEPFSYSTSVKSYSCSGPRSCGWLSQPLSQLRTCAYNGLLNPG